MVFTFFLDVTVILFPSVIHTWRQKTAQHRLTQGKDVVAMSPLPNDLISPKQAAKIVGCHAVTVYRWIHYGILPAYRRGRSRFLVSRADLDHIVVKFEPLPEIVLRTANPVDSEWKPTRGET